MGVGVPRVVGDDRGGLEGKLPDAPAIEEIGEAMVELRHHQDDAAALRHVAERPRHAEPLREGGEALAQGRHVAGALRRVEHDAHEEPVGLGVVVLLRVEDVEPRLEQVPRHRRDDAGAVGAGEREDEALRDHQNRTARARFT
jgi:hypothetical protein